MSKPFKGQVWDRGSAHHVFFVEGNSTYDKLLLSEFNFFPIRFSTTDPSFFKTSPNEKRKL